MYLGDLRQPKNFLNIRRLFLRVRFQGNEVPALPVMVSADVTEDIRRRYRAQPKSNQSRSREKVITYMGLVQKE